MFLDIRFPTDIAQGAIGGPERRTDIVELRSGAEQRNSIWSKSRHKYDVSYGLRNIEDVYSLKEFFEASQGRLYSFRFKDWSDYKSLSPREVISSTDQLIDLGDGSTTEFILKKSYEKDFNTYIRDITKPVENTVLVSVDDIQVTENVDYTIDYSKGQITFTAPPATGSLIKAGFEFDVPVRFDMDYLSIEVQLFKAGQIPNIDLIEVRE